MRNRTGAGGAQQRPLYSHFHAEFCEFGRNKRALTRGKNRDRNIMFDVIFTQL